MRCYYIFVLLSFVHLASAADFAKKNAAIVNLNQALLDNLVYERACKNQTACKSALNMYLDGDGVDRIYLIMYSQRKTELASKVAAFLIRDGMKITGEFPIELVVYSSDHKVNQGIKSFFYKTEPVIRLEINK